MQKVLTEKVNTVLHPVTVTNMESSRNKLLGALTALYLAVPALLFSYGWLRLRLATITISLIGIFIIVAIRDIYNGLRALQLYLQSETNRNSALKSVRWIVPACLVITIWLLFSGTGGFGFQNADYTASNALFKTLIVQPWPLRVDIRGIPTNIVYYIGYYLPAAAIGKLFGWDVANLFIFLWTLLGVALSFTWFCRLSRIALKNSASRLAALAVFFCLAGGGDLIGYYVLNPNSFNLTSPIEAWAVYFLYQSNTALIYWVPQHTIAAWLITGMLVDALYEPQNLKYLGMTIAASVICSPFGALGIVPYLVLIVPVYLSPKNRGYLFNRASLFFNTASIWVGGINILYIGANQFKFPNDWIWNLVDDRLLLANNLFAFWLLEFAFLAFLVIVFLVLGTSLFKTKTVNRSNFVLHNWIDAIGQQFNIIPMQFYLFFVCLIVLTFMPFYKMGFMNDFVMRSSIPSLFIFWMFVIKVILDADLHARVSLKFLYATLLIIVILGFASSIVEISRAVENYQFGPPALSSVPDMVNAGKLDIVKQRAGARNSFFYRYISSR